MQGALDANETLQHGSIFNFDVHRREVSEQDGAEKTRRRRFWHSA